MATVTHAFGEREFAEPTSFVAQASAGAHRLS
jgi:hypothetical protein